MKHDVEYTKPLTSVLCKKMRKGTFSIMYRKTKKLLATVLTLTMLLTMTALTTLASASTALTGTDRYDTALKIAKAGWTTSDTVVIARGDELADALAAAPLKAPILLTETGKLPAGVLEEVKALGAKTVYIVGGTGAVSAAVETELKTVATVERLAGADRVATSVAIANKVASPAGYVLANATSYADALSVSAIAAAKGMPILLVLNNKLSADESALIAGKTVYAVGGTGVLSDAVIGSAKRLGGADRYATNAEILKEFAPDYSKIYIARGENKNLVDALAGSVLAAKGNNPIVLVNGKDALDAKVADVVKANIKADSEEILLGAAGTKAADAVEALKPKTLAVKSVSALNGKTVEIVFTKPVLKSTVVTDSGLLKNITFTKIGSAPDVTSASAAASLSKDGLTLTITPQLDEYFGGDYAVLVPVAVTDADDNAIIAYSAIKTLKDTVRPSASVSYPSNGVARVTFSEPMKVTDAAAIEAAMTITAPTGEAALTPTGRVTLASDNSYFDMSLTDFTADKNYTVTLVGLSDYAGNLIYSNPTVLTIRNSTVDNVKPTITAVEALDVNKIKITYSEKLSVLGTVNGVTIDTTAGTGNATVDSTGLVYTVTTNSAIPALNGVTVVTIAGFKDLSANVGDTYTKTLNFVTDTTNPTYVSSKIVVDGANQYLYVTYSEPVTVNASATAALTGSYVDANSITHGNVTIETGKATNVLDASGNETNTIKIDITGIAAGTYTVVTNAALVKDLAAAPNSAASATMTFAYGTYADPTVPTVSSVSVQDAQDTVAVVFDRDVTAATALNTNNYTVEGQNMFKSAIFDGDAHHVKLTLNPNVITVTGNRVFSVKNIATAAGKVMADYNVTKNFVENVKPYLVSAKVASKTTITATFNKAVTGGANAFEVYVDGTKIATGVTAEAAAASKTVTITVPEITNLTKTYTVKFVGTDFVDGTTPANSAVSGTTVTVAY